MDMGDDEETDLWKWGVGRMERVKGGKWDNGNGINNKILTNNLSPMHIHATSLIQAHT